LAPLSCPTRIGFEMTTQTFKYDLAVSFAGEQRELAKFFAQRLDATGYSVFYDGFLTADLWGKDLTVALKRAYAHDARYCLILLSEEYVLKPWTEFERKNAISRFIAQRGEYVLCLKIDDVELPGFPEGISYVSFSQQGQERVYSLILSKLGLPDHKTTESCLSDSDLYLAQEIINACYRRATRVDRESAAIDRDMRFLAIRNAEDRATPAWLKVKGSPFRCERR
jgi:hypothetical protein